MNRRTCPDCGGRSYFSGSGVYWDCPYCGKNLDKVPNEQKPWNNSSIQSKLESRHIPSAKKSSIWPNGPLALFFCIGITLANCGIIPGTYSLMSTQTTMSVQFHAADTFAVPVIPPDVLTLPDALTTPSAIVLAPSGDVPVDSGTVAAETVDTTATSQNVGSIASSGTSTGPGSVVAAGTAKKN